MENNKEKENNSKRLAIIALLLALLACSFGFAAFSRSVNLPEDKQELSYAIFKGGVLSINPNKPENGKVFPTSRGGANAEPATLTENGIININVHFTKPGQSATYSFFGVNPTKTLSYLNNVTFGDKVCIPKGNASNTYVQKACENIIMIISVKNDAFYQTIEEVDGHVLAGETNEPIAVTIKYLDKGEIADGSFDVDFGISTITYSDVD